MAKQQRRRAVIWFLSSFIISTLIFSSVITGFLLIFNKSNTSPANARSDQKISEKISENIVNQSGCILFVTSLKGDKPDFFALISLSKSDQIVNAALLPDKTGVTYENKPYNVCNLLQTHGVLTLKTAVCSSLEVKADRVVYMKKNSFTALLDRLSPPEIDLAESVKITDPGSGLQFEIEKGHQKLNSITYLDYLYTLQVSEKKDLLISAFASFIAQRGGAAFGMDGSVFFQNFLSDAATDLSSSDLKAASSPLKKLFGTGGSTVRTFQFGWVDAGGTLSPSVLSKKSLSKYFS